jgi:alanine dehydrogenase
MVIGILKERFEDEQRVALSPFGVESIIRSGAEVIIEAGAGLQARFTDEQYQKAGATIAYSPEEAAGRAGIVLKVMPPERHEWEMIGEGQMLMSFQLLGMGRKGFIDYLLKNNVTCVAFEHLRGSDKAYPVLRIMSEISGQVAAQIAGRYLRSDHGGRGVLLGGLGGIAPAATVILGAGASGMAAAQSILGLGGQVILLDHDLDRHGVIHYCVPNMPSVVARTSTYALTNVLLPYLKVMLGGFDPERETTPCVRCGVITHKGEPTHSILNDVYGIDVDPYDCCQ